MSTDPPSRRSDDVVSRGHDPRREYEKAAEPVLRDLERAGVKVVSLEELGQQRRSLATAAPILLRWLPRVQYVSLKLSIVAALGDMRSPVVASGLVEAFEQPDAEAVRWEIGSAIERVADDSIFADVVRLVRRTEYGKDREMLAMAFARMDRTRAIPVLLELLDDDVVAAHAADALRKLAAPEARKKLEGLKDHPRSLVRREAAKALAAIDRAEARGASPSPQTPSARDTKSTTAKPARSTSKESGDLHDASTNFDVEQVRPFLERLSATATGFGTKQIAQVMQTIDGMDVDDELSLEFEVKYRGLTVPLNIGIFMDDVDAPDLDFSTTPDLASRIRKLIEAFFEEHEDES